jgi:2,4-didehydro-3-deoxy-L-rhamnonate hydrolase
MRLYTFETNGQVRLGAEVPGAGRLIDLNAAEPAVPGDMLGFIQAGPHAQGLASSVLQRSTTLQKAATYPLAEVKLLAPIPRPGKILCSGINYRSHLDENPNARLPEEPFFFAKMPSVVIGPGEPILYPRRTKQLDYEIEFAAVIGRRMASAPESDVMGSIFGYTIVHDVSARDVQFKDSQITLGKNFDSFCPIGPCVVTADEIPHPADVRLRTYLNGEIMQEGSTADWLFSLPQLLSFLSHIMALEPGDVVTTGTPAGVGLFRRPPLFLKPGDVVRLEAEGIGVLENPVVAA